MVSGLSSLNPAMWSSVGSTLSSSEVGSGSGGSGGYAGAAGTGGSDEEDPEVVMQKLLAKLMLQKILSGEISGEDEPVELGGGEPMAIGPDTPFQPSESLLNPPSGRYAYDNEGNRSYPGGIMAMKDGSLAGRGGRGGGLSRSAAGGGRAPGGGGMSDYQSQSLALRQDQEAFDQEKALMDLAMKAQKNQGPEQEWVPETDPSRMIDLEVMNPDGTPLQSNLPDGSFAKMVSQTQYKRQDKAQPNSKLEAQKALEEFKTQQAIKRMREEAALRRPPGSNYMPFDEFAKRQQYQRQLKDDPNALPPGTQVQTGIPIVDGLGALLGAFSGGSPGGGTLGATYPPLDAGPGQPLPAPPTDLQAESRKTKVPYQTLVQDRQAQQEATKQAQDQQFQAGQAEKQAQQASSDKQAELAGGEKVEAEDASGRVIVDAAGNKWFEFPSGVRQPLGKK